MEGKQSYEVVVSVTNNIQKAIELSNTISAVKKEIRRLEKQKNEIIEFNQYQLINYGIINNDEDQINEISWQQSLWESDLEIYRSELDDLYDEIIDYLNVIPYDSRHLFEYAYGDGTLRWITLSSNSLDEFKTKLQNGLYDYEELEDYDSDAIAQINITEIMEVRVLKAKKQTKSNDGQFFHYYNNSIFDLTDFQIYRKTDPIDSTNCLLFALRKMGVNVSEIKTNFVGSVPRIKLREIADSLNIRINLHYEKRENVTSSMYYGNKNNLNIVDICLYKNHYFAYKTVPYHMFAINDYEIYKANKIKDRETAYRWDSRGYCEHKKEYSIKSLTFIKALFKKGFFEPMTYENSKNNVLITPELKSFPLHQAQDKMIEMSPKKLENPYKEKTDFYYNKSYDKKTRNQKICEFVANEFKENPILLNKKNKKTYIGKDGKERECASIKHIYFADFESTTEGEKHQPYMIAYSEIRDKKINIIEGEDCAWKFIQKIEDNSLVYFHNLKYDWQFLFDRIKIQSSCEIKGKIYSVSTIRNIKFVDSYKLIDIPLHGFGDCFNLDITKQECPYNVFTKETVRLPFIPLKTVEDYYEDDKDRYQLFLSQAQKFIRRDKFDHMSYCRFYCRKDVDVLKQGMMIFNYQIRSELGLNTFQYLSCAGISLDYLIHQGCFEGVSQLTGDNRKFCEEAAWGGRVAIQGNKPRHVKIPLQDFDAVALYPSAMSRLKGFPIGLPKKFIRALPDNAYNHYFIVKIIIHEVKKWPSLAAFRIIDKDKILWPTVEDAEKCKDRELIVDMITLEDMIKYHDISYTVVEGLIWNEGFNNKIVETIQKLFQLRKKYKKEKNPIQQVYKMIMNSGYGKTLTKESKHKIIYKYTFDEMDKYYDKNLGLVEDILHIPYKGQHKNAENMFYKITVKENFIKHSNAVHCGAYILSMSKRIMNELIECCDEANCSWNYIDTDSSHIEDEKINLVEEIFKQKFGRNLLPDENDPNGELGQFHTDFNLPGSTSPIAIESMFMAPKNYCDRLICKNNPEIKGYHFRIKGISKESVHLEAANNYDDDIMGVYISQKKIKFNMLAGRKAKFEFLERGGVKSLLEFYRVVNFAY